MVKGTKISVKNSKSPVDFQTWVRNTAAAGNVLKRNQPIAKKSIKKLVKEQILEHVSRLKKGRMMRMDKAKIKSGEEVSNAVKISPSGYFDGSQSQQSSIGGTLSNISDNSIQDANGTTSKVKTKPPIPPSDRVLRPHSRAKFLKKNGTACPTLSAVSYAPDPFGRKIVTKGKSNGQSYNRNAYRKSVNKALSISRSSYSSSE